VPFFHLSSKQFELTNSDTIFQNLNPGNVRSLIRKQSSFITRATLINVSLIPIWFFHEHSGCLCCLQKLAKFPVHRHLRYQYPKYYCPQGVKRCSFDERYHFFGVTYRLCRQSKCFLPWRSRYEVSARTGIRTPSVWRTVWVNYCECRLIENADIRLVIMGFS
jgi:hypothetical protein